MHYCIYGFPKNVINTRLKIELSLHILRILRFCLQHIEKRLLINNRHPQRTRSLKLASSS